MLAPCGIRTYDAAVLSWSYFTLSRGEKSPHIVEGSGERKFPSWCFVDIGARSLEVAKGLDEFLKRLWSS